MITTNIDCVIGYRYAACGVSKGTSKSSLPSTSSAGGLRRYHMACELLANMQVLFGGERFQVNRRMNNKQKLIPPTYLILFK